MSQAWHEHLQHLSWWEELDRFFNPSKYSCTTFFDDGVWHILLGVQVVLVVGIVVFCVWYKKVRVNWRR